MTKLEEFIKNNTNYESGWNQLPGDATSECEHWLSAFVKLVRERAKSRFSQNKTVSTVVYEAFNEIVKELGLENDHS